MKKSVIFALVVTATMASVNASAQQLNGRDCLKDSLNDFRYMSQKMADKYYTDHYLYSKGEDPHEYSCCTMEKHGAFIGIVGGVQSFDGHVVPNVGPTVGWDGKYLGFDYVGTFTKGDYTEKADRSNSYVEFDSKLAIKVKLLDNHSHSWQLWLGAYGSYKLNFDYHKNESSTVIVRETEDEIITTTDKVASDIEVKGSSMGYGGQLELVFRPYMSKVNYRLCVWGGQQQRFYDDGNRWHPEFGAEVKVTFNFNAQKIWDKEFLKKTGLSKKEVKKLNKTRQTISLY